MRGTVHVVQFSGFAIVQFSRRAMLAVIADAVKLGFAIVQFSRRAMLRRVRMSALEALP